MHITLKPLCGLEEGKKKKEVENDIEASKRFSAVRDGKVPVEDSASGQEKRFSV